MMALFIFNLLNNGIQGYSVVDSHHDVNGKWGGYRAWVVHYRPYAAQDERDDRLEIYMHVGNYYEVGSWNGRVSRWRVASAAVEMTKEGVTPVRLLNLIWLSIRFGLRL